MSVAARSIIWGLPDQLQMIQDAARTAGLQIVAAGSDSPEAAADLSTALDVERITDLRQAAMRSESELLLLTVPTAIEDDARRTIAERSIRAVSCQPQFGTIADLVGEQDHVQGIIVAPLMRHSPGFRAVADMLSTFGEIQSVNLSFRCGSHEGSVFGRLYDAIDAIRVMCGDIESIGAATSGPLSIVPESLHELRGHLSINLRFKSNRCACASITDQTGTWFRGVTILGQGGCVRLDDRSFEWIGADGRIIDSHREPQSATPGELIGMQIMRMSQDLKSAEPPPDNIALLAVCEATRLSCLTGQEESPGKLIEMLSRP